MHWQMDTLQLGSIYQKSTILKHMANLCWIIQFVCIINYLFQVFWCHRSWECTFWWWHFHTAIFCLCIFMLLFSRWHSQAGVPMLLTDCKKYFGTIIISVQNSGPCILEINILAMAFSCCHFHNEHFPDAHLHIAILFIWFKSIYVIWIFNWFCIALLCAPAVCTNFNIYSILTCRYIIYVFRIITVTRNKIKKPIAIRNFLLASEISDSLIDICMDSFFNVNCLYNMESENFW